MMIDKYSIRFLQPTLSARLGRAIFIVCSFPFIPDFLPELLFAQVTPDIHGVGREENKLPIDFGFVISDPSTSTFSCPLFSFVSRLCGF